MQQWQVAMRRGRRLLSRHEPESALKRFEEALADCPVENPRRLSEILFYLGITFAKLRMTNCAVKSWNASRKAWRHGYSVRFLNRFANEYGMARQRNALLDEWNAFYSIHLERYLGTKRSHRLGTDAERDMLRDLIRDAWNDLRARTPIATMAVAQKIAAFQQVRIVFPAFNVPDESDESRTIRVDFKTKQKVLAEDPCICGSGLPYRYCCGREQERRTLGNGNNDTQI